MQLTIVHLYPKEMNIYGDTGNRLVLQKRAEWRGVDVQVKLVGVGDPIPGEADLIIGGGGTRCRAGQNPGRFAGQGRPAPKTG
jgi:CobQ-like glutamine amidotransferase family enzyme